MNPKHAANIDFQSLLLTWFQLVLLLVMETSCHTAYDHMSSDPLTKRAGSKRSYLSLELLLLVRVCYLFYF